MSEDLPGDLMLCEGCIDERQTESEAAAGGQEPESEPEREQVCTEPEHESPSD